VNCDWYLTAGSWAVDLVIGRRLSRLRIMEGKREIVHSRLSVPVHYHACICAVRLGKVSSAENVVKVDE